MRWDCWSLMGLLLAVVNPATPLPRRGRHRSVPIEGPRAEPLISQQGANTRRDPFDPHKDSEEFRRFTVLLKQLQ